MFPQCVTMRGVDNESVVFLFLSG